MEGDGAVDRDLPDTGCPVAEVDQDAGCGGHGTLHRYLTEVAVAPLAALGFVDAGDRDDTVAGEEMMQVGA